MDDKEPHETRKFRFDMSIYLDELEGKAPIGKPRYIRKPLGAAQNLHWEILRWFRVCVESHQLAGLYMQSLPREKTLINLRFFNTDKSVGREISNHKICTDFEAAWAAHVGQKETATLEQSDAVFFALAKMWLQVNHD